MTEFVSNRSGGSETGESLLPKSEIERKYLLAEDTVLPIESIEGTHINQGYLRIRGETEARVRQKDSTYTFTVKTGKGIERGEAEASISQAEFMSLWQLTEGRRVEKTRYDVPLDDMFAEVDIYSGKNDGLRVVEVEFIDRDSSEHFTSPGWFGPEVTTDKNYKNQQLALDEERLETVQLDEALEGVKTYISVLSRTLGHQVVVAVAGGSASGKTSAVADRLSEYFGDKALAISLDDYYRGATYMAEQEAAGNLLNWDQPEAVDLERAAQNLSDLRKGSAVSKPIYDFKSGERNGFETVDPDGKQAVIVEGLFALTDELAEAADITLFVNIETHGRMMRRLLRDVVRTSWSPNQIVGYLSLLEDMHQEYVQPTMANADIVIDNGYQAEVEASRTGMHEIQIKYPLPTETDITEESLRQLGAELIIPRTRQEDTFYDSMAANLPGHDELIRIRESNDEILFGYKGPRDAGLDVRRRPKIEFPIDRATKTTIEALYPKQLKKIVKERETFYVDGVLITLDDVSVEQDGVVRKLGKFMEFRSNSQTDPSGELILKVADRLGLASSSSSLQSYFEME